MALMHRKSFKATLCLVTAAIALSGGTVAFAQAEEEQGGQGEPAYTGPLGLTQNAWNEYLRNRGESKERPGYVKYTYDPEQAFPIRIREGMITTIKLPEGEEIVEAYVGDDAGFNVGIPNPRNIVVKAIFPGVDTNLIAYAESGNIYTFYLRSESYSSKQISDFLVDVAAPRANAGGYGSHGGATMMGSNGDPAQLAAFDEKNPSLAAERIRDPYATIPDAADPRFKEYAEWTDFDPSKIREDLGVYVPLKQTGGTIPYRVFRDDRFTYIDYGAEASQMTEWPTPLIVIQGVEGPVGNRTAGPGGRMIVIEALGDFILRNGQRTIVVKPRASSPDAGMVEYPTLSQARMEVPSQLPPGRPSGVPKKPQTVVSDTSRVDVNRREYPSQVAQITNPQGVVAKQPTQDIRFVSSAVIQETPVAKGGGSPIRTVVETTPTPVPAGTQVDMGMVLAPAQAAQAAQVTVAQMAPEIMRPEQNLFYVSLGTGMRSDLEDQWKSAKVQYYEVLQGREPTFISVPEGFEMRIEGFSSAQSAIKICEAMANQPTCSVRSKN